MSIDNLILEHSVLSYLDIQDTELRTLSLGSTQGMWNLKSLYIMDLELYAIDAIDQIFSGSFVNVVFNDKRFCCIFIH